MEEDTKEYAFRIYLAAYPNMTEKNFKTFNDFWDDIKSESSFYDNRSKEDIMDEILNIPNNHNSK